MLKILIVDDEPPARARLAQVLADCSPQVPLALAGEAEGGFRALEAVDRLRPDVVLLDIHMNCECSGRVMNGLIKPRCRR